MFLWLSSFNSDISLMAVAGIPSEFGSNFNFFIATYFLSMLSNDFYTLPYVPLPISSPNVYRSPL